MTSQTTIKMIVAMAALGATAQTTTPAATATTCAIQTRTVYGINTSIANTGAWYSSVSSKYYTDGASWSGSRIPVFTSTFSQEGVPAMTGYGFMQSDILAAEGYKIVSTVTTATSCGTASPAEATCSAHGDHWHCPEGVDEPAHGPEMEDDHDIDPESETECTPHVDHWHCPEGVEEPDYAPGEKPTASENNGSAGCGEDLATSLLLVGGLVVSGLFITL